MSSSRMKRFVSIKGVLDNLKQSVSSPSPPGNSSNAAGATGPVKLEQDIIESLVPEQFACEQTLRHGFPYKPLSLAFDPLQKILAIGNRVGTVRLFGKPGIDLEFRHKSECQVLQIIFLVNTGTLLTACTDNTINLWDFKKKTPELVNTLKLSKEHVTVICLEFQDKWLYIGTDMGNVHVMSMETFQLSGYRIDWNRLMNLTQKDRPGAVVHMTVNPADSNKLLIGMESGLVIMWDLALKKGEGRFLHNQKLYSLCWHMEGKQFVASYGDGSLATWSLIPPKGQAAPMEGVASTKPASIIFPHGKRDKESGKMERCEPIEKVLWRVDRSGGVEYFVFSGGLTADVTGPTPCVTFMKGKNTTLLEMEYCVRDFVLATDSPYASDYQEPEAILVMLTNDLVAIDCKSPPNYPCFKNPYAMDFNDSPVTCCKYVVDCPDDLILALYRVGSVAMNKNGGGFSKGQWPVSGGIDGTETCPYSELLITGHADGSVRFWDASSTCMQSLYKIKTAKFFEKVKRPGKDTYEPSLDEDPFSINNITLCTDSRLLAISGASAHVILFKFKKKETATETKFMEIPIVYEVSNLSKGLMEKEPKPDSGSDSTTQPQHFEFPPRPLLHVASQSSSYTDPCDAFNFDKPMYEYFSPLRLRPGAQKKSPGYHADLVCLTPWVNGEPPTTVKCLTLNANYGLMAYGNGSGLVIVDLVQNICLLNMGTADLYGSIDPFQRLPKSPKPLGSPSAVIQKIDLSNYSQMASPNPNGPGSSAGAAAANNSSSLLLSANENSELSSNHYEKEKLSATVSCPPKEISRVKSPDARRIQKAGSSADESSFSKSQSSSINSLDQVVSSEGVSAVDFADSFSCKNDFTLNACCFVGTTLGSVIMIVVNLPDRGDPRTTEPVVVSPSGSLFRIRGTVLTSALFDSSISGLTIRGDEPLENVYGPSRPVQTDAKSTGADSNASEDTLTEAKAGAASSSATAAPKPTGDQQVVAFCTEKAAAVYALPSQRQMYMQTINESTNVVTAEVINFGGVKYTPCLVTYMADGFIKAFSLPSLRPMLDMYFKAMSSPRIGRTMSFSNYGHGCYMANSTEVQKFSVSSNFMRQLPEMTGRVFTDGIPMPEPPKPGFLKGLIFGSAPKAVDRDELFGDRAGKASSGVAKTIPGENMVPLQAKGAGAASEVSKAHQAMIERGQKLNEIEDQMENMSNEAKEYARTSHNLMNMYKNKKWWQI